MRLFLVFFVIAAIFFGCKNKSTVLYTEGSGQKIISKEKIDELLKGVKSTLSISEYLTFLKQLQGVAYDEDDNEEFFCSILYKPQVLEAALSTENDTISEVGFNEIMVQKSAYYYVFIAYSDKNHSINKPTDKKKLSENVKNNILILKNQKDTVNNYITESFSSLVMGQPEQLLLMIPKDTKDKRIQVILRAGILSNRKIAIDVSKEQEQKFPKVKI